MSYYPFMYLPNRPAKTVVVVIASYDLTFADTAWMNDNVIGHDPLTPTPDLIKEKHFFNSESEALAFIKSWWTNSLNA